MLASVVWALLVRLVVGWEEDIVFVFNGQRFARQPNTTTNRRPIFFSSTADPPLYAYSLSLSPTTSRWMVGETVSSNSGIAFVDTFAVSPTLVEEKAVWQMPQHGMWVPTPSLRAERVGMERTVFVRSQFAPHLGGLYISTALWRDNAEARMLFGSDDSRRVWLYRRADTARWYIGHDLWSKDCVAFCACDSAELSACIDADWMVSHESGWRGDGQMRVLVGVAGERHALFDHVRRALSVPFAEASMPVTMLHDGALMPTMGYGTGGLGDAEMEESIRMALSEGFGLIDTAEIYGRSEEAIGSILESGSVRRESMFVSTKVWPTHLGAEATTAVIHTSLARMRSSDINLVMLHWPECRQDFDWMDCSSATGGTWRESWRALEQAYQEGHVLAIGVSNFDLAQLDELLAFATIPPHVVQNWFDLGHHDWEVLDRCHEERVVYQAYSPLRALVASRFNAAPDTSQKRAYSDLLDLAPTLRVSPWAAALRWHTQQQMAVVIRTRQREHLIDNRDSFRFVLTEPQLRRLGAHGGSGQVLAKMLEADWQERRDRQRQEQARSQQQARQHDFQDQFFKGRDNNGMSTSVMIVLATVTMALGAYAWHRFIESKRSSRVHFD